MAYTFETKDYSHLIGMQGFSDGLLNTHFELYEGYVENASYFLEALEALVRKSTDPDFGELHRRLGFELNGVRLHELYFENLGGGPPSIASAGDLSPGPLRAGRQSARGNHHAAQRIQEQPHPEATARDRAAGPGRGSGRPGRLLRLRGR